MQPQPIKPDDFWYAVNNTEIVVMPAMHLATFGETYLHYHLVSELMDTVNRIRVREGTIQSKRPQIITPTYYGNELLDGFGEQAHQYLEWLQAHAKDLHILQYGFQVEKKEISEQVVTGNLDEIVAQVKQQVQTRNDALAGVIRGVDAPWDVCLLKFMVDVVRQSAPININEFGRRRMLQDAEGVPRAVRNEIERAFLDAGRHPDRLGELGDRLRKHNLFEEYEDRFFALVRQHKGPAGGAG